MSAFVEKADIMRRFDFGIRGRQPNAEQVVKIDPAFHPQIPLIKQRFPTIASPLPKPMINSSSSFKHGTGESRPLFRFEGRCVYGFW